VADSVFKDELMKIRFLVLAGIASSVCFATTASAFTFNANNFRQQLATYTLDTPHAYVSGNIGISQLFDKKAPGSSNNVDKYGPGWNVNGGYQFNSMWGAEAGFTDYYNSRETFAGFTIAKTQHYSVDVAGTVRLPMAYQLSALGKLGLAYSYANKMFIGSGASASANALNLYWGIGMAYSITPKFDIDALYANARGNSITGSAGLFSIGLTMALV